MTEESILGRINSILCDRGDVVEFGLVITSEPPHIIIAEGRLGISMAVLKPLFREALEITKKYSSYDSLGGCSVEEIDEIAGATRALLFVKGDFVPAFNIRKQLLIKGRLKLNDELAVTQLVLSKHPKSPAAWFHRRFAVMFAQQTPSLSLELSICQRACDIYPKNYYAWNYRLWLLSFYSREELVGELDFCVAWLKQHVSDHSAVNHYVQVLQRLASFYGANITRRGFIDSENLLQQRPGHESLWYLRRMLTMMILPTLNTNVTTSEIERILNSIDISEDSDDIDERVVKEELVFMSAVELLDAEAKIVAGIFSDVECWEYEKQQKLAAKYILFLVCQINGGRIHLSAEHVIAQILRKHSEMLPIDRIDIVALE